MISELRQFFKQFSFISASDVADIMKVATVVRVKKGQQLIVPDELDYNFYTVLKGFVRVYLVRSDGEERTVYLAGQGMTFGSSKTIFAGKEGNEYVVALENCILLKADTNAFKAACEKNPKLYKLYTLSLEQGMLEAIERLEFHSVMNPDQRYEYLLKNRPEVFERVQLKYIASFIGITPVTLSRLRARIAKGTSRN